MWDARQCGHFTEPQALMLLLKPASGVCMPELGGVLYSYCGLLCELCPAYVRDLCEGCDAHIGECLFAKCAVDKGARCCFECSSFPCQLHREGFTWETGEYGKLKWRVYSKVFLDIVGSSGG